MGPHFVKGIPRVYKDSRLGVHMGGSKIGVLLYAPNYYTVLIIGAPK